MTVFRFTRAGSSLLFASLLLPVSAFAQVIIQGNGAQIKGAQIQIKGAQIQVQGAGEVQVEAQIAEPDPFAEVGEKEGDPRAAAAEASTPVGAPPNPEPLSAQISQHILKLAEEERDKRLKFMAVVIDDVSRLCDLDAGQRQQLDLAAKGAAERSMKDWHTQAERYFRTKLDGADSDAAKEMLEGMGRVNFGGNRSEEEGESLDLWKDTLRTVLSEDQVERYEQVLEQRHLDRIEAFAKMSVSTLDSHLRLTPDQKKKMGDLVHRAASDHLDDVQRYWGDYFEKGMLMSLANAAEADDLKAILSEPQFDRLKESTSNFDHFWDQKRRLKRAKAKAAEQRAEKANKGEEKADEDADAEEDADADVPPEAAAEAPPEAEIE